MPFELRRLKSQPAELMKSKSLTQFITSELLSDCNAVRSPKVVTVPHLSNGSIDKDHLHSFP